MQSAKIKAAVQTTVKPADMTMVKVDAPKFGLRDKLGYMLGDIGNCSILGLVNSFLMIYYTNVLGLAGGIVGTLFLIARCIDAFSDLAVGRYIDVAALKPEGRSRPWIQRMKYPFCIISILLFAPIATYGPEWFKIVYVFVTYLAYGVLLSCINIPFGSMASAISGDPDERASLSTFRSVGAAIGMSATGFFIPMFIYVVNHSGRKVVSGSRFFIAALICTGIAFILYNVTYKMTTERVQVEKHEKVTVKALLEGLFTNKALLALVLVDFFVVVTQILYGTTTTYLFNDYFHSTAAMSVAMLFNWGTVVVIAPPTAWAIKRFGKKEVASVALPFSSVIFLLLYVMHTHNAWVYVALMFFGTIGYSVFNVMVWALITDVIDYHQYSTGLREDGTVYGLNSFSRKVAQAVAGGVGGIMLSIIGYQASTTGGAVQSAAVENRIYALTNLLPAVLFMVAALILIFCYPMNKKTTDKVAAELRAKRQ